MRNNTKIVGIIGAYNHPNFGDQLLFNILHGWIKEICPEIKVCVPWGDVKGIQWPEGVLVGGGVKQLLCCNAVIYGGGGYFGEPGSNAIREPEQYTKLDKIGMFMHLPKNLGGIYFGPMGYLRAETFRFVKYGIISKLLSLNKIPYCIIGTGLGPVTTWLGRWGVRTSLVNAQYICLRDADSVRYAKEIASVCNIEESADMVLYDSVPISMMNFGAFTNVALHFGPRIESHLNLETLLKLINTISVLNVRLSLVSDCKPPETDGESVFEKLSKALGDKVEYIPYNGVDAFVANLEQFEIIITTKLHSGILGYNKGIFPISVAEHVKTKRFYRQIGLASYCFNLSEAGFIEAIKKLDEIIKSPKQAMDIMKANREDVKLLAIKNKITLVNFINKYFN